MAPDGRTIAAATAGHRRVLLYGATGTGKSTLASRLAACLAARGERVCCVGADPGSPTFGVPGTVGLAEWPADGPSGARPASWRGLDLEPLCSLDAVRFRLPLAQCVARLARRAPDHRLIVDAPGVTRGVAGAETLHALVDAAAIDAVLMLARADEPLPLAEECAALGIPVLRVRAHPDARRQSAAARAQRRTALWDHHLASAAPHRLRLDKLALLGTPPPADAPGAWSGRQIAVLRASRLVALGEVQQLDGGVLAAQLTTAPGRADALLVRDAARNRQGLLATAPSIAVAAPARPRAAAAPEPAARGAMAGPLRVDAGALSATLINGVFGDPLLELDVRGVRGRVLFDLGDAAAVPARTLHAVSDVFLTHAHLDHICGFPQLLRARLGGSCTPCRIFGPPGTAAHVAGFVAGFHWDRIGDAGPEFQVAEVFPEHLVWTRIKAGQPAVPLGDAPMAADVLRATPHYRVRHVRLDHAIDVLAFAIELPERYSVRPDRLEALGLPAGPWLATLKYHVARGALGACVRLPDGRHASVAALADELLDPTRGTRLVYATDFADTRRNRAQVAALAQDADLLFCEATFRVQEAANALRTQHLTTRATGEIAAAARVQRLVPFHFSRRYLGDAAASYAEVAAACAHGTPQIVQFSSR